MRLTKKKRERLEFEAQLAYEKAYDKAWKAYQAIIAAPRESFEKAVAKDFEIFNQAVDEAVKAYDKAVA